MDLNSNLNPCLQHVFSVHSVYLFSTCQRGVDNNLSGYSSGVQPGILPANISLSLMGLVGLAHVK